MNKIGFLFGNKNEWIVIFTQMNKSIGEIIVGELSFLPKNCKYYFLDKTLKLNKNFIIDSNKIKYAKISLSQNTIISYEDLLFWFSAKKYKEIKQIFEEDFEKNSNSDFLIKKVVKLYNYF